MRRYQRSMQKHQQSMRWCQRSACLAWQYRPSALRYPNIDSWHGDIGSRHRVPVNIGDCGVGISPQMHSRVIILEIWEFFPDLLPWIDDKQCHTQTQPQLETEHYWLHGPVVLGVYRQLSRTVLQNRQEKIPKASPNKHAIMEHTPVLPQDTKSLRSCCGNWPKMLINGQFRIKCHSL